MSMRAAPWTEREDTTLAKIYPTHGARACKERLGRSVQAVYARAFQLGLTGEQGGKPKAIRHTQGEHCNGA